MGETLEGMTLEEAKGPGIETEEGKSAEGNKESGGILKDADIGTTEDIVNALDFSVFVIFFV